MWTTFTACVIYCAGSPFAEERNLLAIGTDTSDSQRHAHFRCESALTISVCMDAHSSDLKWRSQFRFRLALTLSIQTNIHSFDMSWCSYFSIWIGTHNSALHCFLHLQFEFPLQVPICTGTHISTWILALSFDLPWNSHFRSAIELPFSLAYSMKVLYAMVLKVSICHDPHSPNSTGGRNKFASALTVPIWFDEPFD